MNIWTTKFWKVTGTRTVKTMAQAALGFIGTEVVGITDVEWYGVASASALAGVVCILMAVAYPPTESQDLSGGE